MTRKSLQIGPDSFVLAALLLCAPALAGVNDSPDPTVKIQAGQRLVKANPNETILPGMDARPCNDIEMSDAWDKCAVVALLRGGRVSAVHCSVRAERVQATCILEPELGNPINW